MIDSDLQKAKLAITTFRYVSSRLDLVGFSLLKLVYKAFFNLSNINLFSSETVVRFYGRVQMILGVFMIFQLAMSILKGIVDPDTFFGQQKGFSNVIKKIVVGLIMLAAITPISMSNPRNEYEKQLNNNGLLFGTLYSLQYRVIANNTLGRLILGTNDGSPTYMSTSALESNDKNSEINQVTNIFATTILKGFYRVNLLPGKSDPTKVSNRVCQSDEADEFIETYSKVDADPSDIIAYAPATCEDDIGGSIRAKIFNGGDHYMVAYSYVIGFIVALIFSVILIIFSVEVVMRSIKLGILRLIAPIPIISYMNPDSKESNSFNSWVKTLSTTYLDLFLRLAIIYFVIFLIQDICVNGLNGIYTVNGSVGVFSIILVFIGLFVFAFQAPKFFKQALGIRDDFKMFSGIGAIVAGAGAIGAAITGGITQHGINKQNPPTTVRGRLANFGKTAAAAIGGLNRGALAGIRAANSDNASASSIIDAQNKKNAEYIAARNQGSTALGRAGASAQRFFTGQTKADKVQSEISALTARKEALESLKSRVSSETPKQDWTYGSLGEINGQKFMEKDKHGKNIGEALFNYKENKARIDAAIARGDNYVSLVSKNGTEFQTELKDAIKQEGYLQKNNEDSYIQQISAGTQKDAETSSMIVDVNQKGGSAWNGQVADVSNHNNVRNRDDITQSTDALAQQIRRLTRENVKNQANAGGSPGGQK